uniref:HNH nuclease domain-containing protein n=1 Tax=Moumouvirus sp. 'Monve' TaxID=1128131 RepID=H2EEK4_9VIRU|nr:hypothetical protein mv_R622 [Moumouvirus Monve]
MKNRKSYTYYLHNEIMDKEHGGGKGQKYTIDHISRNTHDNRKVNLRLVTQTTQNENQKRRERTVVLPDGCSIDIDEIPKCVYYQKPQSGHGEMFVLELKKNGVKKCWKSSSSVKKSLEDKLIEIKEILLSVSDEYPELMEDKNIIQNYSDEAIKLIKEFNAIIKLTDFDCVEENLIKVPKK